MADISRTETIDIGNDDDADVRDPFTSTVEHIFLSALEDFKASQPVQCELFAGKGINHVKHKIIAIQNQQERQKAMLNFTRIQSYLERFAEFDSVCRSAKIGGEASDELSEFIWGPTAYILQISQEDHSVLDFILDAYHRFGQRIPALGVYSELIKARPNMMRCVAFMYHDLLQFSRTLVKFLTGRGWKKRFKANWKDYGESFEVLLKSFDAHSKVLKNLLDSWSREASNDLNRRLDDHIMRTQDNHQQVLNQQSHIGQDVQKSLAMTRDVQQQLGDQAMRSQDQHDFIQMQFSLNNRNQEAILQSAQDLARQVNGQVMRASERHLELQRHIQQYEQDRVELLSRAKEEERKRKEDQRIGVLKWMSTPGVPQSEYHGKFREAREECPGTGLWILSEDKIFNWMNEETPPHSLLWLNGKKGAGKTILTSLIVDNCMQVEGFKTSYFYCREDDDSQNTCLSILKGILRQMVVHNEDMLPSCHEKRVRGEERLNDLATIKSLLELFCDCDMYQFVIIDGLDECRSPEIKPLVQYWASMVEKCDNIKPGKLRVLLVSQDIADIRKLSSMQSADIFDLLPHQSDIDISKYVSSQFSRLQREFELTEAETRVSRELVCSRSQGMFLYAVLTMENLLAQATTQDVKDEIKEDRLPETLEVAYTKIIDRLQRTLGRRQWEMARKIFGWLAGAKRPLHWHELQAALSIQTEVRPGEQPIDFHNCRLRKDVREICGSLIQVLENRIEFIHSTTRSHIINSEHLDERVVEYDLTVLCLKYLVLPCFHPAITDKHIRHYAERGWYAFQDYAISKWKYHLENLIKITPHLFTHHQGRAEWTEKFAVILEQFLNFHQKSIVAAAQEKLPTGSRRSVQIAGQAPAPTPSNSTTSLLSPLASQQSSTGSRSPTQTSPPSTTSQPATIDPSLFCQPFLGAPFYESLVQLWTHVCRHQTSGFKERNRVSLPLLADLVEKIRRTLEKLAVQYCADSVKGKSLRNLYGTNFYKCQRVTCDYFHEGFDSEGALDKHSQRHDRPFQCPVGGCSIASFGFSNNKDRDKHVRQYHPDDEGAGPSQFVAGDPNEMGGGGGKKTVAVAKWACHLCPRKFTRQVNLKAHVDNHYGTRSHACETCGKMFTRSYDRNRHRKIHVRRPLPVVRG